jgi:hypothetical protein
MDDMQVSMHANAGATAGSAAGKMQGRGKLNSGVDAAEAARKRWEKARARDTAAEAIGQGEDLRLVTVPASVAGIIRKLDADARKGAVNSARELREWLRQYPPEDTEVDMQGVDPVLMRRMERVMQWVVEDPDRWESLQQWMISLKQRECVRTDRSLSFRQQRRRR